MGDNMKKPIGKSPEFVIKELMVSDKRVDMTAFRCSECGLWVYPTMDYCLDCGNQLIRRD